jgi:cytochrome c556
MQKASDDMLKLAKVIDTANDLRAIQKELMWSNCSACHNRFRAEH